MCKGLNIQGFWLCLWLWVCDGSEYARVTDGWKDSWIGMSNSWICLNMLEYARICMNLPKTAWMAFYVLVPLLIFCLLERVVNYFNEVYGVKELGYFLEEKKLNFFYVARWVIFCCRLNIFRCKVSNLLSPLGAEGSIAQGQFSVNFD